MRETECRPDGQQGFAEEFVEYVKDRHKPWFVLRQVLASPGIAYKSLQKTCDTVGIKKVKATVRNLSANGLLETIEAENGRFVTVTPNGCWAALGLLDNIEDGIQPIETPDYLHQPKPERRGKFETAHGGKIKPKQDHGTKGLVGITIESYERCCHPENTVKSIRMKQVTKLARYQIEEGIDEHARKKDSSLSEKMSEHPLVQIMLYELAKDRPIEIVTFPKNSQPPTIADLDGKIKYSKTPEYVENL
ncbi:MAG: hypothetical protein Q7K55_05975 [Candidatus Levybacteria bacterium]|nr:hypothetical protein [Candidatus Levybacteria bacterium]